MKIYVLMKIEQILLHKVLKNLILDIKAYNIVLGEDII